MGSAAVSLAVPTLVSRLRGSKVDTIPPAEAMLALGPESRLIDIRTRSQIRRQGVPFTVKEASRYYNPDSIVIHAPKMIVEKGKAKPNPNFEDEVMFDNMVHADTSFVILDSFGSSEAMDAASKIASLGNRHDICVIKGGFEAWKAAGLPWEPLPAEDERRYFCAALPPPGDSATLNSLASAGGSTSGLNTEVIVDSSAARKQPIFRPKLLDVLTKGYTAEDLKQDVLAGMTIGIIALSLSMALGIASESTPAIGLYTAIVSGFLISALGGSKVVVGGPTAAFIPIVVGIAHEYGPDGLIVSTGIAGAMLVVMGATGLGSLVKFVPRPVVTGFTAGIATYIFSTQIKDFLGLGVPGHLPPDVPVPAEFLEKIFYLGENLPATHGPSLALAAATLALIKFYPPQLARLVPAQITAVIAGTVALFMIDSVGLHTEIETIGSHFGANAIPSSLPVPHVPEGLTLEALPRLLKPSLTIALLASIESLLCARVSDTMVGDRHNPNTELIAQGVANIASCAFGALPATGALARTAANVRAGARSPVSGMVHAATIVAVILVAAPAALHVPLPCLSAVLVVVAINMGEWHNFTYLPGWPEKDAQLFLVAFTLTLLQDVSVAVEVGMFVAILLFVSDVTSSMQVRAVPPGRALPQAGLPGGGLSSVGLPRALLQAPMDAVDVSANGSHASGSNGAASTSAVATYLDNSTSWATTNTMSGDSMTPGAMVVPHHAAYLEVTGSLLFGAGDLLEDALDEMHASEPVRVVLLDMSHVSVMDVSGLEVMEEQAKRLHLAGKQLIMCGLSRQPLRMLSRAGFLDELGRKNVCRSLQQALARAAQLAEDAPVGGSSNGSGSGSGSSNGAVSGGSNSLVADAIAAVAANAGDERWRHV